MAARSPLGRTLALPLALLALAGCLGTPPSAPSMTARVNSTKPGARESLRPAPSASASGPSNLKNPTPTPSVSATASPTAQPSASPTLPPAWPKLVAQPVALNPLGQQGFSDQTRNLLAVSSTLDKAVPGVELASAQADSAYRLAGLSAAGTAPEPPPEAARLTDPHLAFRAWERGLVGARAPRWSPGYRVQQATRPSLGSELPFYVITSFSGSKIEDKPITARCAVVGAHCYVMIDKDVDAKPTDAALLNQRAREIAQTFDTSIYPTNTRLFGFEPSPGVDGDAKIFILLSPAVGNYGKDNTLGFFSQRDEYQPTPDAPAVFQHSNAKEMLYISSRIVLTGSAEDYMGTIAHEFQHMINFNQKVLLGKNRSSDDLWIDEGMAMYAIEACGYGLKTGGAVLANHVKRYQQEPEAFSLTDWTANPDGIGYGPVYLFMVYLADRFSESIIKDIVTAKAIGTANIEAQLKSRGASFNRVFHDWAMANLLDGRPQTSNPAHQYASLEMVGANGKTRLSGFATRPLPLPGKATFSARPCTARYYELPRGESQPRFSFSLSDDAGSEPRLVLP